MIKILIRAAVLLLAAVAGLAILANWDAMSQRARDPRPAPSLQHGVQPPAEQNASVRGSEGAVEAPVAQRQTLIAPEPLGRMGGLRPAACPYEDGDPEAWLHGHAWPCIWQNPRTGKTYYVDSVEYLD